MMSLPIHLEVIQAKRRSEGGGGGAAWYDSVALSDLTIDAGQMSGDTLYVSKVVITGPGNATKLRVYAHYIAVAGGKYKMGLYDAGKNLVVQSAEHSPAQSFSDHYEEIAIPSTVVAAGTYYVALNSSNSNDPNLYCYRSASAGESVHVYSQPYSGAMQSSFSASTAPASRLFGVYVS